MVTNVPFSSFEAMIENSFGFEFFPYMFISNDVRVSLVYIIPLLIRALRAVYVLHCRMHILLSVWLPRGSLRTALAGTQGT
jgi:hypothetical protein